MYTVLMNRALSVLLLTVVSTIAFAGGNAEVSYEDPAQVARLIRGDAGPYYLVDVRTPEEYAAGHLSTAVNIPVTQIESTPPTPEKGALIVVYCRSGGRSTTAKTTLDEMGYTNVVNFGAISRWTGDLVTGDQPTAE